PYFGFGVVGGAANQGVQALSSFHSGLEFEFASNFSIAATFVLRRTRALLPGYTAGSAVSLGTTIDAITHDSWRPGFGLVINASPSFLQFATGTSAPANNGTAPQSKASPAEQPRNGEQTPAEQPGNGEQPPAARPGNGGQPPAAQPGNGGQPPA